MSDIIVSKDRPSLARYAADLEAICLEIDEETGEITDELVKRFDDARLALADKTDRWIGYLDAIKHLEAAAKERKDRAGNAQKTFAALNKRLRDYIQFVIESSPGVPLKGSEGSLALQKNPESVKIDFDGVDKTFYRVIDPTLLKLEPTLNEYVKTITCYVIDNDRLKADLKAGKTLSWARLERGSHVRIR